ncbi:MAG TPA: VWA domain-containing protein [Thermoleophilaceae bacterium]
MSFGSPYVLLLLLALPVLVGLYVGEQQRRRRAAEAFALQRMQPSVAPRRPRWRRHLPMLAFLFAMVILIAAAARPQRTIATPIEKASIMLATDVSGSMTATDVQPNRLVAAKQAARAFLDKVPARVNVGVMAFNQTPTILASASTDREAARNAIAEMKPSGGTASGEAIATAVTALRTKTSTKDQPPPAAIVLLSDGKSTSGRNAVQAARSAASAGVRVYTVALGTDSGTITVPKRGGGTQTQAVPPDPQALQQIAEASGGRSFTASTTSGLSEVYEKLGSQLGHKTTKKEITAEFAGGGLALLLLGGVMSLGWFGRLA